MEFRKIFSESIKLLVIHSVYGLYRIESKDLKE